ncbi:hypothetical protein M0805_004430 [Coniferiporia weirii]|nr:hypothetical protein M0805_004430 [Coniferiporia weirii]
MTSAARVNCESLNGPEPPVSPAPGAPSLKRASKLYTLAGEPTPALDSVLRTGPDRGRSPRASASAGSAASGSLSPHSSDLGTRRRGSSAHELSASLRRKLKDSGHALRRSITSAGTSSAGAVRRGTKHARSRSENLGTKLDVATARLLRRNTSIRSTASLSPGIGEASTIEPDDSSEASMDDDDIKVPLLLQRGTPMIKVSAKKKKLVAFRIDPDGGYIRWESKKSGIIPIENIKEIRSGADARYYRQQFQLSADYEERWLTIVYIADGRYKTLHVVATDFEAFAMWDITLRALYAERQELMCGLGHFEKRQSVWERRYWRGADEQCDDRLTFDEAENMCRRLNISSSKDNLMRRFQEADTQCRGYLDFADFRRFVKLLKDRPELTRLYKKLTGNGPFDFAVFESFMRVSQKSFLSKEELEIMFRKYAGASQPPGRSYLVNLPPTPPASTPSRTSSPAAPDSSSPCDVQHESVTSGPLDPTAPPGLADQSLHLVESPPSYTDDGRQTANPPILNLPELNVEGEQCDVPELTMSLDAFTSFLLSTDNSVFSDQHGKIWQDMRRPLSEYFISSSHNTYLVGHQLVGVSTIEGYIRALLLSCRSVEIDIYDGETEPVIYHGKTLTSKVPLRDICQAIAKYAFVASPYPIIISAEVHCSVVQQDLTASIMRSVFGDALISAPVSARPHITELPSPEDLRGRVLLKAKNLYLTEKDGLREKHVTVDAESSSTDTSASDSEIVHEFREIKVELKHELNKARNVDAVKEIKEEFSKARNLYDRVRGKRSPSPAPVKREGRSTPPPPIPVPASTPQNVALRPPSSGVASTEGERSKVKMSFELAALLVYTIGVKCRGFNKKETYAPEHVFSLSERTANKVIKQSVFDLVKHNRTHVVRIYPNGTRLNSSNFEPHRYWSAGAQLVAINWQTFDLGYMINHAMFQRNGRAGESNREATDTRTPISDKNDKREHV